MNQIDAFMAQFLGSDTCISKDPKERILHWVEVARHPEDHTTDKSPHAIAAIRKNARQNVRRLAVRNPKIAAQLMEETE